MKLPDYNKLMSGDRHRHYLKKDRIGIDTGLAYGGQLTVLEIEDGKIEKIHSVIKLAA